LTVLQRVQRIVIKRDLLATFVMVFLADIAIGTFRPTFSLFARDLGASLTMIGVLSGTEGLTRILSSVPIGMISDTKGRKGVLSAGLLIFAMSYFLYTLVPSPYLLFPIRVMTGLSVASTFFIGIAYVSDVVAKPDQGLTIGLYTSCMGLGFAIGSSIGGHVAENYGFAACYRVAALVTLLGFVVLRWGVSDKSVRQRKGGGEADVSLSAKLGLLVKEPGILAASLGNLLISVVLEGAIFSFFPLYAASFSVSEAAIGSMFSVRALMSTSARLPTGALTAKFPSRKLMIIALVLAMTMVFSISFVKVPAVLGVVLAGEGIAFGMFLAAGHTFVAEHSTESNRGTATGIYNMAGSVGTALGPFVLGPIADLWGLDTVFWLAGVLVFVGLCVIAYMASRQRR
jgi:DHA1 family multidrug resistance protein-like MFS transporter